VTAAASSNLLRNSSALFARALRKSERVVVPINDCALANDPKVPAFFCVHSISGAAGTDFLNLAKRLEPYVRLYGIQAPPKFMQTNDFGASIEALSDMYANAVVELQPSGPLMLGGYCVGAIIALDMANKLRAAGRTLGPLVAIDGAPENVGMLLRRRHPRYWLALAQNLRGWLNHSDLMRSRSLHSLAWSISNNAFALGKGALGLKRGQKLGGGYAINGLMDLTLYPPAQREFINRLYAALFNYVPTPYVGDVVVYEAKVTPLLYLPQVANIWRSYAPQSEIIRVVGTHIGMMHEPYVDAMARDMCNRILQFFSGKTD
jgi:thioesterase domain-containing protein